MNSEESSGRAAAGGAAGAAGAPGLQGASGAFAPRSVQPQCEVIGSEVILGRVDKALDLTRVLGKKFANGDRLRTFETTASHRGKVDVRPTRSTSVMEIRIYSERRDGAAKIANANSETYRAYINHPSSGASTAIPSHVEIIDRTVPTFRFVHSNKSLKITQGVLMGLVLGLVPGAGACFTGLAMRTKQPPREGITPSSP